MERYKKRLLDEKIERKLQSTGGILLKGVRFCGKTTTAMHHAASSVRFDESDLIREQATLAPKIVLQGDTPRLLDEWQLVPSIWNAVRSEIDAIVELSDETWAAFEMKLGSTKSIDEAAGNLQKLLTRLTPEKAAQCVSLNVLIAGASSYTRKDNVNVISLGHLFA